MPVELSAGAVGTGLILIGIALLVIEGTVPGWGGPGALGVVSLLAGVLFVLDAGEVVDLSRGVVIALSVAAAIFVPVAAVLVARARRVPEFVPPTLVGSQGIALSDLDPYGTVRVHSEEWSAESDAGRIEAGSKVRVVSEDGLRLHVDRY